MSRRPDECSRCRHLETVVDGAHVRLQCQRGHVLLDADRCGEFFDCSSYVRGFFMLPREARS